MKEFLGCRVVGVVSLGLNEQEVENIKENIERLDENSPILGK